MCYFRIFLFYELLGAFGSTDRCITRLFPVNLRISCVYVFLCVISFMMYFKQELKKMEENRELTPEEEMEEKLRRQKYVYTNIGI